MVRRHPLVFAQAKVKNAAEVTARWDEIKRKEKQGADAAENPTENPFAGIPTALPALLRSQKIGHKSIRYNFDWSRVEDVIAKVEEELGELKDAIRDAEPREAVELEVGDLLFSVTQLARHLGLDAEQALRKTNRKFEKRFVKMQELVAADGKDFKALTVDGLEEFWKRAKAFDGA
jgi:MazG family protein